MRALRPHDPAATYATVLDALPIVAFMAGPVGNITFLSRGWDAFSGHSGRDIIARGYQTIIHPDDLDKVVATWKGACKSGVPYRDEFRLRLGNGEYCWVLSQANPLRESSERIVGWFGTVSDINDLRLTDHELASALSTASANAFAADARAHFVERLMDASDDCIKVLDLDARIVSISANGQRALAITDFASVAGSNWLEFWSGADRVAAEAATAVARSGGRGRFTGQYTVQEREMWWDVSLTAIAGSDGRPERLLVVSRDVTEYLRAHQALARSEERYRVLGETMPGVTWTATPDGQLDHISGRPSANRLPTGERLGDGWLASVHSQDREAVAARWRTAVESGAPYDARFRVRMMNGDYRWQLVRAQPQRDENDAIVRWVGVNVDVDDERRSDEAREQFVRLVETSADFIAMVDVNGDATYVNEAGRVLLEIGSMEEARGTNVLAFFTSADRSHVESTILPAIARDGRWLGEYRFCNFQTGVSIPVWITAFSLFDEAGNVAAVAIVGRDLRERLRVEAGMRALADTGATMYGSLDFDGTVKNVADAVARSFASCCTVETLDDAPGAESIIRCVAAAHRDPDLLPVLERAAAVRNLRFDHPLVRAITCGETTLIESIPPDWMERNGVRDVIGADIDRLDVRSLIFVPIRSAQDGFIFGALTCILDGSDARGSYIAEDVRFASEIAARAGIAFDHVRAYERERRIAVTLQNASLPELLPAVDRLRLSADYRPGKSEATIGGDWYDAFLLDDGRVVFTIGDVLGKGLGAAVIMGKLRQAMQSVAMVLPDPNTMLDAADRTVRAQSSDTYATALAGIFDPATDTLTFASAGHPGPALRYPDGRIEEFDFPALLLGLRPRGESRTTTIAIPPGTTMAFFTDGLIEATRDMGEGHRRLHDALADPNVQSAVNPARAIVEHVLGGLPATDDIAVLVAELTATKSD